MLVDLLVNADRAMLASLVRTQARGGQNPPLLDDLDNFKALYRILHPGGEDSR